MSLTYGFCLGDEDTLYNSAQFSDAIHAIFGDGITPKGSRFSLSVNGMTATLSTGYALAAGRWTENDEQLALPLRASGNNDDRTDALVVRVDYTARMASIEVLTNVDAAAIRSDPSILKSGDTYDLILYLIEVHRGATSILPLDITDLRGDADFCGYLSPLADVAESVLYVYRFLTEGLDAEEYRLIELSKQAQSKADAAVVRLSNEIAATGVAPAVGELLTTISPPIPAGSWLLCTGDTVPEQYPELNTLLGGTLPEIAAEGDFNTYIYAGRPVEGS